MSVGAVLVVLIVSNSAVDPAEPAMAAAARELLGQSASVRIELTPEDPPDAESLDRAGKADGVVELFWAPDQASALLHCYVARDARWVDRTITFSVDDRPEQRGRLLGFAIASMFPRLVVTAEPPTPPREEVPPPLREGAVVPREGDVSKLRLDLGLSAVTGIRGPADAWGATLGIRLALSPSVWARLAVGGRVGEVPAVEASTRTATAGVGLSWLALHDASPAELGVRADFQACWLEVTRSQAADAEVESRSRWMFGGAALFEGGYRLTRSTGLFAGAGVEALLGETDIYAEGHFGAKLPIFRAVAELGLRVRL